MPYDDDKKSSPIVPFALGGFIVWLLMRKECPTCEADGATDGTKKPSGHLLNSGVPVVAVYYGKDLGFQLPDNREEGLFVANGIPKPGSKDYSAQVSIDSSTYTITKVTPNPSSPKPTTVKVGDLVRRMKLDASGAWIKYGGY